MQRQGSGISEQLQLYIYTVVLSALFSLANLSFSLLRKLSGFGHIFMPVVILRSHIKSNNKRKQIEHTKLKQDLLKRLKILFSLS